MNVSSHPRTIPTAHDSSPLPPRPEPTFQPTASVDFWGQDKNGLRLRLLHQQMARETQLQSESRRAESLPHSELSFISAHQFNSIGACSDSLLSVGNRSLLAVQILDGGMQQCLQWETRRDFGCDARSVLQQTAFHGENTVKITQHKLERYCAEEAERAARDELSQEYRETQRKLMGPFCHFSRLLNAFVRASSRELTPATISTEVAVLSLIRAQVDSDGVDR